MGYKSQTNFIQTFKGIIGMTPSTYQKIARGQEGVRRTDNGSSELVVDAEANDVVGA